MDPWLRRVRHDLIKRAVWVARDLRDSGSTPLPSDLRALRSGLFELVDDEGNPIDARALWARLCEDAPSAAAPHLKKVADAIDQASAAVKSATPDATSISRAAEACLAIEAAFDELARSMNLQN